MKILALSLLFTIMSMSIYAADKASPYPADFFEGNYELVGRDNANRTYYGTVKIKLQGDKFKVTRQINGRTLIGTGRFEYETADNIQIMVIEFSRGKHDFTAAYQLFTDMNNYGILVGATKFKIGDQKPGLETLYPN